MTPGRRQPAKIAPVPGDSRAAWSGKVYRKILIVLAAVGLSTGSRPAVPRPASSRSRAAPACHRRRVPPRHRVRHRAAAPASANAASSDASLQLLTEPAAGIDPIYQLITGAHSSVDLTMYELDDSTAEADLAADAARGVNVRVLLDQHLEKSRNTDAYNYLTAHNVHVQWAPSDTTYHQKTLTVDNATSAIMTLNLVSEDYPGTRDFAVIDTNHCRRRRHRLHLQRRLRRPEHRPARRRRPGLVTHQRPSLHPVDHRQSHPHPRRRRRRDGRPGRHRALASAAHRGVNVTVTMTADSEWDRRSPSSPSPARTSAPTPTTAAPSTSTPKPSSPTPASSDQQMLSGRRTSPPPASPTTEN